MFSMLLLSPKKWQAFGFGLFKLCRHGFYRIKEALASILSILGSSINLS